ncbi:hypothetical protein [Bradyrhizobium sp. BR 1433]|uniref:hypothetical protein n=1 Tax=Bradyrhizobium sp. BR 1433 TaxID=3447967 RepID=UPI003EE6D93F
MAAGLTHDLNQPLTAIINSVDAAKRLLDREDRTEKPVAKVDEHHGWTCDTS